MFNITVNFEQAGLLPVTFHNILPGKSLLEIFLNNNILLHHTCGGVCACSTCHLYVIKGPSYLEAQSVKEKHFINRAVNPMFNSRLACQCLLIAHSGEVEVTLPDQTQLVEQ